MAFAKQPSGSGVAEKRIADRPTIDISRAALEDLLDKVKIERCGVNAGYLEALGLKVPKP